MPPSRTLLLAGCCAALSGCEEPPTGQTWAGEFVTLSMQSDVRPCGGTPVFLDRFVDGVGSYWTGASWPASAPKLSLELRDDPDADFHGRVTSSDRAWSGEQAIVLHELVHLITVSADGGSAPALLEGLAEGLGQPGFGDIWFDSFYEEHPEVFAYAATDEYYDGSGRYYTASAQMVAALSRRYGIAAVRRAYQLTGKAETPAETEAAYVEAFGDTIYDTFDEIADERPCGFRQWQCDESVVPAVSLPYGFSESQTATCGQESGLIGAEFTGDTHWYPEAVFAVEFEEETSFMFEEENAFVFGFACRDTCEAPDAVPPDIVYPYVGVPTTLPAGRYFFRVRSGDRANAFSFSFDPV